MLPWGVSLRVALATTVLLAVTGTSAPAETRGRTVEGLRSGLALAERELQAGRLSHAATLYDEARVQALRLGSPNLPLARALDGLADVHRLENRPERAAELYLRSIEIWETIFGPRQPRLATSLHNLGVVCLALDRPDLARTHWLRALEIWEASLGHDSPEALNTRRLVQRLAAPPG